MSNLVTNRRFKRLNEHYVKIGNINILIQPDLDTLNLLRDYLGDTGNQVIHVFELYPISIPNLLSAICESVHLKTKIFIHVPRMLKDFVRVVEQMIDTHDRKVRFITERKEVIFKYYEHQFPKYFKLSFEKDYWNYYIHIHEEVKTYGLPASQYFINNDNSVRTRPQMKYPELFKDDIIKNFKRSNPKGIVKTFKTDDEIWNFLIENEIIRIKSSGDEDEPVEVIVNGEIEKL